MADLKQLFVARDGRVKAVFADGSVLLLSSSGACFVHACDSESGRAHIRQLSEYAVHRYACQLATALEFRNMHLEAPYVCKSLLKHKDQARFTLGHRISTAWWPSSLAEAEAKQLVQRLPDGSVGVCTEDQTARILLHFHRRRFAVCYPLLISEGDSGPASYTYLWQTQLFSLGDYPPRWQPAVALVLAAANAAAQPEDAAAGTAAAAAAATAAAAAEGFASVLSRQTELPTATRRVDSAAGSLDSATAPVLPTLPSDSWWLDASTSLIPSDVAISMEWTPSATYQYLPASDEVVAWIHADDSCLHSLKAGRFLAHCRAGGSQDAPCSESLYAAGAVPERVWASSSHSGGHSRASSAGGIDPHARIPLAAIAAHALKFRSLASAVNAAVHGTAAAAASCSAAAGKAPGDDSGLCQQQDAAAAADQSLGAAACGFEVSSEVVVEQCSVEGCGRFTAFQDGRCRICFQDRTILELSRCHSHCRLILPDGAKALVSVAQPAGLECYVSQALQFAAWAFKTPAERAAEIRTRQRIQAEIQAAARMAALCTYAVSGQLPAVQSKPALPLLDAAAAAAGQPVSPSTVPADDHIQLDQQPRSRPASAGSAAGAAQALGLPFVCNDRHREQAVEALLHKNAELIRRLSAT